MKLKKAKCQLIETTRNFTRIDKFVIGNGMSVTILMVLFVNIQDVMILVFFEISCNYHRNLNKKYCHTTSSPTKTDRLIDMIGNQHGL